MAEHVVVSAGVLMTDSGEAIVPGLRANEHAALDHSAMPGIMTVTQHAVMNHATMPGVPAAGLTQTTHGSLDHSAIPGAGISPATHAATNHAGMPGVPTQGITVSAHAAIDHTGITGVLATPVPSVLVAAAGFLVGAGVPAKGIGADGNFYFRVDGGALSHIYVRAAGVWVGLV